MKRSRHQIQKVSCSEHNLPPKCSWHVGGKKKRLGSVKKMTMFAFSIPILSRGVNARRLVNGAKSC